MKPNETNCNLTYPDPLRQLRMLIAINIKKPEEKRNFLRKSSADIARIYERSYNKVSDFNKDAEIKIKYAKQLDKEKTKNQKKFLELWESLINKER